MSLAEDPGEGRGAKVSEGKRGEGRRKQEAHSANAFLLTWPPAQT